MLYVSHALLSHFLPTLSSLTISLTLSTLPTPSSYSPTLSLHFTLSLSHSFIKQMAGMVAGACTPAIVTPVEFVKCNLQVQGQDNTKNRKYTGPLDCIIKTVRENGIRGMYKGYVATVMRESPGSGLWYLVIGPVALASSLSRSLSLVLGRSWSPR
jgi:Mitochondrial carrier protein